MYPANKALTKISYRYGEIYHLAEWFKKGTTHKGVDIAPLQKGQNVDVLAPVNGSVLWSGWQDEKNPNVGFGRYIIILFNDKAAGDIELHFLAHLEQSLVNPSDVVTKGQKIGVMGDTGYATGVHLHYEVRKLTGKGIFSVIPPYPYMS